MVFWILLALLIALLARCIGLSRRGAISLRAGNLALVGISLLVALGVAEFAIRVRHMYVRNNSFFDTLVLFHDDEFGWRGKEAFGNRETARKKILVIGDSFTHGLGVPEEKLYYSRLGKALGAEIFAYAGPGYGTLQELLVLNRFIDKIQPNLVILQLCTNDFLNNDWELERQSYQQNAALIRPYLEQGTIVYRYPRSYGTLRVLLSKHSRAFHSLFMLVEKTLLFLSSSGYLRTIEWDLTEGKVPARTIEVTEELLRRFRDRASSVPIVAFLADRGAPFDRLLAELFGKLEVPLLTTVAERVHNAHNYGPWLADGVHWSDRGHAIVADELVSFIAAQGKV